MPQRESEQDARRLHPEGQSVHQRDLVRLASGTPVSMLPHQIWLVVRGLVKLTTITPQGDLLVLGLAGPNQVFGALFTSLDVYGAVALGPVELIGLTLDDLRFNPVWATELLPAMANRLRQSEALITLLGLRRVEERLRGLLELLASDYGQPCELGLKLELRLTHQDLASALCTSRVTITRLLGSLRDQGWLQPAGRHQLVIPHLAGRC